ncbi:MAG: Guanylate kinase [Microgenomates group bacterium GW2011_GWC1_37_8]|uniref:Guanylate kinase n=1 Tax=Candidatus Woesebacteria bacterium GW2011_GWB1_38_8 TaxID=1618570 RepID=A0A0G0LB80_9BACT|nr:MAG: Guanylate kinase [Microgenomates group bacterium GW2011_GWC1_37_8]KKQ85100.1 MAG: Guanylate kinase [Candidatus Woesebacteria bacterium GW2011_GWB1_38_8]
MDQGKLIIITGFMASGKDTVVNKLIESNPDFKKVITHTSRPPRANEKHGVDYNFVSKYEFRKMIKRREMLEHVIYESHYKGTSKKEIEVVFDKKDVIWRIDMERAAMVENLFYEKYDKKTAEDLVKRTIKVLLKPENLDVVFKRYKKRDLESYNEKRLKIRLNKELNIYKKYQDKFPNIIENKTGKINRTLTQIRHIIS